MLPADGWSALTIMTSAPAGGSEPLDLVPLCPLCHEQQPICETREEWIAFVKLKHFYVSASHPAFGVCSGHVVLDPRVRQLDEAFVVCFRQRRRSFAGRSPRSPGIPST